VASVDVNVSVRSVCMCKVTTIDYNQNSKTNDY